MAKKDESWLPCCARTNPVFSVWCLLGYRPHLRRTVQIKRVVLRELLHPEAPGVGPNSNGGKSSRSIDSFLRLLPENRRKDWHSKKEYYWLTAQKSRKKCNNTFKPRECPPRSQTSNPLQVHPPLHHRSTPIPGIQPTPTCVWKSSKNTYPSNVVS